MRRREVLLLFAGAASLLTTKRPAWSQFLHSTLLDAPLETLGDWGNSPQAAAVVLSRTRAACLSGVRLLSDRQPGRIRVENRNAGSPAIWLHDDGNPAAFIIVNVGERDWCKLAYQFGHELGHVFSNSWAPDSKPRNPCQWLEEALVQAFSLRGLGKLADSWEQHPPFTDDAPFADSIREYRKRAIEKHDRIGAEDITKSGMGVWFLQHKASLERDGGIAGSAQAAVPTLLKELEANARSVESLGALNRWPGRSSVAITDYLRLWKRSCKEIGASVWFPRRVADLLQLGAVAE